VHLLGEFVDATDGKRSGSLWAKASTIVAVFLVVFVVGGVLSARIVDFVNASG